MFGDHQKVAATSNGSPLKGAPQQKPPINKTDAEGQRHMLAGTCPIRARTSTPTVPRITVLSRLSMITEGTRAKHWEDQSQFRLPEETEENNEYAFDIFEDARSRLHDALQLVIPDHATPLDTTQLGSPIIRQ